MLKIIAFILLLGLIALVFALCVGAQELSPYDMNGDGYVNVQDVNGFGEALSAGYFTVQDINPFLLEINSAKPEMTIAYGLGMTYYAGSDLPYQDGLDPDGAYIVCHGVEYIEGEEYIVTPDGWIRSVADLCRVMGRERSEVNIIVVQSATQP